MRSRRVPLLLCLAGAVSARPLAGQALSTLTPPALAAETPPAPTLPDTPGRAPPDGVGAALGAIVGGAAGMVMVGYGAYHLTGGGRICGDDPCGLAGLLLGGLVGETVGIGLGAHVGGGRRGHPLAGIGASLGVLILGAALAEPIHFEGWVVAIPVGQVIGAVAAELTTAQRRR